MTHRGGRVADGAREAELEAKVAALEGRLQDLVRRLANVLEIARIGSWEIDLDTMVAVWSPETRVMLGVAPDAPATPATVIARCAEASDREAVRRALEDARAGSRQYNVVYRIVWTDGSQRVIHSRGDVQRDATGRGRRIVGVVQDVTEQEQLRLQLLHSQKLETVGRLAAGVAHDLNNMLTVIQGACEFVADAVGEGPARQDVATIQDASERAAGLTRALLAFSRQQVLQPQRTDVNLVIGSLRKMLVRAVGESVVVDLRTPQAVGTVFVDPQQLAQVLVNLAVNARDAMPRGGTLTLETAEAPLPPELGADPRPHVRIRVRDTGIGMDRAKLSRVFEPFFTTKGAQGTGLGLSTAFGVVTQSGGQIRALSAPGRGTTMEIYLPIGDRAPVRKTSPSRAGGAVGDGATVLVVEDDPAVRKLAVRALDRAGFRVLKAGSGDEALGYVAGPVDVLVTDVMMPGASGREVADSFRAVWPNLPVLFMSGYAGDPRVDERGPRRGDPFLEKPFSPEQLVERVRQLVPPRPNE